MLKTEQTTIVHAQWNRWASYDMIKHHMITMLYQNSSKGNEDSTLLRTALSRGISSFSIIFSLKSLLSLVKIEKVSKDG